MQARQTITRSSCRSRSGSPAAAFSLLLLVAAPAAAAAPENVQGLGPDNGQWELEYVGQFGDANGSDDEREHSGQSFYGVTDWLAIGGETQLSYRSGPLVEEDRLYFDYDSVIAILRFSDAEDDVVGTGLWLQAALDSDGELARLEARFIAEKKSPNWWGEANVMLRRVNEEAQEGAHFAYAGRLSYALADGFWLGAESSGQAMRVSGFRREPLDQSHYLGPRIAYQFGIGGNNEASLALGYLRRLDGGEGLRNLVQLSAKLRL